MADEVKAATREEWRVVSIDGRLHVVDSRGAVLATFALGVPRHVADFFIDRANGGRASEAERVAIREAASRQSFAVAGASVRDAVTRLGADLATLRAMADEWIEGKGDRR